MLQTVLILVVAFSICLPLNEAGDANLDKFEKFIKKFDCKGEKLNVDVVLSLMKKKCKKEIGVSFACTTVCYYRASGLLEDDYRYFQNKNEAIDRMVNLKLHGKKLAKTVADVLEDSKCENKFPSKGTDDCKKAITGIACFLVKLNKFCSLGFEKEIAANA